MSPPCLLYSTAIASLEPPSAARCNCSSVNSPLSRLRRGQSNIDTHDYPLARKSSIARGKDEAPAVFHWKYLRHALFSFGGQAIGVAFLMLRAKGGGS
jgi:hypothetical protein